MSPRRKLDIYNGLYDLYVRLFFKCIGIILFLYLLIGNQNIGFQICICLYLGLSIFLCIQNIIKIKELKDKLNENSR